MITLEAWENGDFGVLVNGEIVGQINHEDVQTFLSELKHIDKMLKALEWLSNEIDCRDDEYGMVGFTYDGFRKVKASIKKARGEE